MRLAVRISIDASELNRIPKNERYYYIKRELCAQFGVELMRNFDALVDVRQEQYEGGSDYIATITVEEVRRDD